MSQQRPRDLVTAQAEGLRRELEALADTADPAALSALRGRHPGVDPDLVAALATQVRLRRRAHARLGDWAVDMIAEEEALQQATRPDVARYRAARLAQRLGTPPSRATVADIGCGLGVDARALAEAGFAVMAIERDAWRAEAAEVNLAQHAHRVRVVCADATALDAHALAECDAAYVDPARRAHAGPRDIDGGRSRPTHDPRDWSPPWPWVVALAERLPVVAKVAPGFDVRHAPGDADIEWIDHDGDTVEACTWLGTIGQGMRCATALEGERAESIQAPRARNPGRGPITAQARRWLLEPSPAVIRAQLLSSLAERLRADRLDGGDWLTVDVPPETILARAWHVVEEVPHGARELRAWLRGRGSVTWKTTDAGVPASTWDRRVGHRPGPGTPVTVVITGQGRAFEVMRTPA